MGEQRDPVGIQNEVSDMWLWLSCFGQLPSHLTWVPFCHDAVSSDSLSLHTENAELNARNSLNIHPLRNDGFNSAGFIVEMCMKESHERNLLPAHLEEWAHGKKPCFWREGVWADGSGQCRWMNFYMYFEGDFTQWVQHSMDSLM